MDTFTTHPSSQPADDRTVDDRTVEGIVRVVRMEDGKVWLEPEQTAGCGSCSASGACGTAKQEPGIGTITSRMEARRFMLEDVSAQLNLKIGDRIVIGLDNRALIKGSLVAYGLPLFSALASAVAADSLYNSDGLTLLGAVIGLVGGFAVAWLLARRLTGRGEIAPRFLRWAKPGETCNTPQDWV